MKYDELLKKESQKKVRSKPRHIESQIQIQMVKWFRLQYPRYIIAAIPNGGQRSAIEAKIMKGEGVLAGFSDLIIIAKGNVLFVEVKTKSGYQSDLQAKFQSDVERLGFQYLSRKVLAEYQGYIVHQPILFTKLYKLKLLFVLTKQNHTR